MIGSKSDFPLDASAYRIVGQIGQGPSSAVYKAECVPLNNYIVSIKKIFFDRFTKANPKRLLTYAKALSLLAHPNILKVHCSFIEERELWIVTEYMFARCIEFSLSTTEVEYCIGVILKEALKGLCYLHDRGFYHGNLKPENILIGPGLSVKLADVGISALVQASLMSHYGYKINSPYWNPPEGAVDSKAADVWRFGIIASELIIHGRSLHMSKDIKMFRFPNCDTISSDSRMRYGHFSKAFWDMYLSCNRVDPAKRPTSSELLNHTFFKDCIAGTMTLKSLFLEQQPAGRISGNDIGGKDLSTGEDMPMEQGHQAITGDPTAAVSKGGTGSKLMVPYLRSLVCTLEAQKDIILLMAKLLEEGQAGSDVGVDRNPNEVS